MGKGRKNESGEREGEERRREETDNTGQKSCLPMRGAGRRDGCGFRVMVTGGCYVMRD